MNLGESVDNSPIATMTHAGSPAEASKARASRWPNHDQAVPLAKRDLGLPLISISCHTHWRLTNGVWIPRQAKQHKAGSGYTRKAAATKSSCTACTREHPPSHLLRRRPLSSCYPEAWAELGLAQRSTLQVYAAAMILTKLPFVS